MPEGPVTKRKPESTMPPRVLWTPEQIVELQRRYPNERTDLLAKSLGVSINRVHSKAARLGLHKSDEFFASPDSGRTDGSRGASCRFAKGNVPWTKGKRGLKFKDGGARFKKGQRPHNWMPVGSERVNDQGYLQRKLTDTGYPPHDWHFVHLIVWEAAHGPVPANHAVCFRDGDKTHIELDNLECLSKSELMLRNTIHNLPEDLRQVIHLKGVLTRKINGNH
jgi:HNH endonuclease